MCKIYPGIEFDPIEEQVDTTAEKEKKSNLIMSQICQLYSAHNPWKRMVKKASSALDNKDPIGNED